MGQVESGQTTPLARESGTYGILVPASRAGLAPARPKQRSRTKTACQAHPPPGWLALFWIRPVCVRGPLSRIFGVPFGARYGCLSTRGPPQPPRCGASGTPESRGWGRWPPSRRGRSRSLRRRVRLGDLAAELLGAAAVHGVSWGCGPAAERRKAQRPSAAGPSRQKDPREPAPTPHARQAKPDPQFHVEHPRIAQVTGYSTESGKRRPDAVFSLTFA